MADQSIVDLLSTVSKGDARLVSVVDSVLSILEKDGLAYRLRIPPKMVGVHPENRNGYGVSEVEVQALGAEIVSMGFSFQATSHAVCVEDSGSAVANFTAKLTSSTAGLGPADKSAIKYGSLSCSHTNQFLHALNSMVPTDHSNLAVDGRMSPAKLSQDLPLMDALKNGLEWLVISSVVPSLYPSLLDLVQCAKNKTGSVQRKETEIQILLKIQALAQSSASGSGEGVVDWSHIGEIIANRAIIDPTELKVYLRFVQMFGSGPFLADLDKYTKTYVPTGRVLPVGTFSSIVDLKLAPTELAPHMAIAILKTQASCPETKVSNKVCRFISSGDISALAGPKKHLLQAGEALLKQARSLIKAFEVPSSVAFKALARLDTFAVRFVLGKEAKHESMEDIGNNFVTEVNYGMASGAPTIVSPWAGGQAGPVAASSVAVPNMLQYDDDGNAVASSKVSLLSSGFAVGRMAKDKDGQLSTIVAIEDDGKVVISAVDADGEAGEPETVDFERFSKNYQPSSSAIEVMLDWGRHRPSQNKAYNEFLAKAAVAMGLRHMAQSAVGEESLRLQKQPSRSVSASANIGKGKLVTVPETMKISIIASSAQAPPGAVAVDLPDELGGKIAALLPNFSSDFVVPAWAIKPTDNEDEANMEIVFKAVTVDAGVGKGKKSTIELQLPAFVNSKALAKDEELRLYRAPVKKLKRGAAHMTLLEPSVAPKRAVRKAASAK